MRSQLLLAMLLCLLCVAQVQTEDTLRLCGRSFLRAVVYTCGGSRWRRLMGEETFQDSSREPELKTTLPAMNRHWRDQNEALISACCELGCRRSDLQMLC
ncbi:Relaxin-3 [Larimichthys crocea]|uniref:Uncharacterized protein n=1 Tax=Larimichthys crocea TaxID=215358 RepID=A0ACD3QQF4_LARCR|nr:Relaxin-3 [Larimichthys crocea]